MIKTLRRKFIAIAMCSIMLVLAIIITTINIANYVNVNREAEEKLDILAANDGVFPKTDGKMELQKPLGMSPEAPFETRYFTVLLRQDGTVLSIDTGRIAAVSTESASSFASQLWAQGKTSGFYGSYKYRAVSEDDSVRYLFLDCSRSLKTFTSFLIASVLVSVGGLLLVFLLVLLFSRILLRPVVESYEKQRRFITDASHEIKTPLTIIDASADVLSLETGDNEWIDSIQHQVHRLTELTEKMVFLSRMEESPQSLPKAEFSLSDTVQETAQSFCAVAAGRSQQLSLDIAPNISYFGAQEAIAQVVSILLENAIKYSPDGSTITVALRESGKNKELTVTNPAEGLRPGRWDVLFERFYRTDLSRSSETGGSGIGLSVAKAIVTSHKGKIHAKSPDGKSLECKVVL
jgi:signal transduction histidine kinase